MTNSIAHPEVGAEFRALRYEPDVVHLDSAAAGRASRNVVARMSEHLEREARVGGYVAHAEAAETLEQGRAAAAGLLGFAPHEVFFTESARSALLALVHNMPVEAGSPVCVVPSEFGPNLAVFASFGLRPIPLPITDRVGHLDYEASAEVIARERPAFVHICVHPSHRGLVQDVARLGAVCRAAGVPLIADAAQSFAHTPPVLGADAVYATSRKWLCGPRGVGVVGVRSGLLPAAEPLLESAEANIAGRVGFAVALAEHQTLGPAAVYERLAAIGQVARARLNGAGGWSVSEDMEEPCAVTTLLPPHGWSGRDVQGFREALAAGTAASARIVTTYLGPERAPLEDAPGALRISPHLDVTERHLDVLAAALDSA